jgi:RHS repeat-associated protein
VIQQYEPAGTDSISTAYDPDGRVQTLATPMTSWSYSYDKRGLIETQALTANGGTFTIADQFDPQAHVSQRTYPDGLVTSFSPNAWGEASQLGSFASSIGYSANGLVAGFTYGNGLAFSQSLDGRQRPASIQASGGSAGTVVSLQYGYDSDNNVTGITDGVTGAQNRTLGYDGLDRLVSASGVWGSATYGYDAVDNLRTETIGSQTINTVYNSSTNRIDGVSGSLTRSYSYDPQGNLSGNGVNSFLFDVANRLVQTAGVASYRYDGHGRRTITIQNGNTEYSVYDLAGDLVHVYDTAGCVTTDFVNLQHKTVAQTSAGTTTYLHNDELGSPIAATNGSGAWLWYEEYQPYGLKVSGVAEKIGFTGHVYDAATGLTDMQARLYDPLIGRFMSTDPKAFNASSPFSFNRYTYGNDNPYRYKDPDGRSPLEIAFLVADVIELGNAIGSGKSVGLAVLNVAIDVVGVASPVPGISEVAHAAEAIERASKVVEVAREAEKVEEAGNAAVHGNSAASTNLQHRYEIIEKETGKVQKTGISGGKLNKNGSSKRANSQVNKLNREAGFEKYGAEVKETDIPGRAAALDAERQASDALRDAGHPLELQQRP